MFSLICFRQNLWKSVPLFLIKCELTLNLTVYSERGSGFAVYSRAEVLLFLRAYRNY